VDDVQMKKSEVFDNPNFDTDTLNGEDADFDANIAKFDTNICGIQCKCREIRGQSCSGE
jgi:hypothetical protein